MAVNLGRMSFQSDELGLISDNTSLRIQTLGGFHLWRNGVLIEAAAWGREKAVHLFQFFVTTRRYMTALHKEQIIDRLWPELDPEERDRDFKVALNAIYKVLEPERPPRSESRFIQRQGLVYGLNPAEIWIDGDGFEKFVEMGNQALAERSNEAIAAYK